MQLSTQYSLVSYGGGTNSVAMLIALLEQGVRPDAITFADTGGEKPGTYEHIVIMQGWCERMGFPPIETVKGSQPQQVKDGSLEAECLRLGVLPAKAYGFSSCSQKWKIDPQLRYNAAFVKARNCTMADITRLIGFDMDEPSRVERGLANAHKKPHSERYPLYELGWGRDECVAAIARHGLPQPGKSACFYCPSSRKPEILWLRDNHPDLFERAVSMERNALAGKGPAPATRHAGLGRHFSWEIFASSNDPVVASVPDVDCGCYDGGAE